MASRKLPLRTRVERRRLPIFADDAKQLEIVERWINEDHQKLLLLCDELEISEGPQRFYELALALARKHCVGFQERNPVGKWNDLTRGHLVVEIERLTADRRSQPGHTVTWAARVLAARSEWSSFLGSKDGGGEALRVQYQQFKTNKWANVFRTAYKYAVHQGTEDQWHKRLIDALEEPHD